ncbi:MAG: amidohydrolase family protein [Anaerolineales bacterium]|nr:amidohydrolase family protein [Anaerolineales bacterium]
MAWHGDDPYVEPLDPLLDLYSYVTRRSVSNEGQVCDPPAWLADGAITVEEAMKLMTSGSAYALFHDEEAGSLSEGKYADLIALSADLPGIDPESIRDVQVRMTMVGGEVRYCAPEWQPFYPSVLAGPAGWHLQASSADAAHPPDHAIDGDIATWWAPGAAAPQWLQIDLGAPTAIAGISLTIAQPSPGLSIHRVWGHGPGEAEKLLIGFSSRTADGQELVYSPSAPWEGIQFIRIETMQAPASTGWREIELLTP